MIDPNPDPMRCHVCDIDLDATEDDPQVHYCSVECAIGNKDDTEEFGIIQLTAQPWDAVRGRDSDGCWSWIVMIPGWVGGRRVYGSDLWQQALDPPRCRAQAAPGDGLGQCLVVALRWPPRVRDTPDRDRTMTKYWIDWKVFGVRLVVWRISFGWRPKLHRDAYGAVGWRVLICGPCWLEWTK